MEPETATATVTELITALETATFMAKQLPSTTAADSANIYSSLRAAHRHLSLFLAQTAAAALPADLIAGDDEPMQIADEENDGGKEQEEDSKMETIESVEERMRDCFIQNKKKRMKRSLSPASLAAGERRRWLQEEIESARVGDDFDPHVMKLRALDLIYQFHC